MHAQARSEILARSQAGCFTVVLSYGHKIMWEIKMRVRTSRKVLFNQVKFGFVFLAKDCSHISFTDRIMIQGHTINNVLKYDQNAQ